MMVPQFFVVILFLDQTKIPMIFNGRNVMPEVGNLHSSWIGFGPCNRGASKIDAWHVQAEPGKAANTESRNIHIAALAARVIVI
jgi:hypothetical protein